MALAQTTFMDVPIVNWSKSVGQVENRSSYMDAPNLGALRALRALFGPLFIRTEDSMSVAA